MSKSSGAGVIDAPAKPRLTLGLSKELQELTADLVLLAVLAGFFVLALAFSPRAQFMPLVISALAIVCMVLELVFRFVLHQRQALALDSAELFGADKKKKEFKKASEATSDTAVQEVKEEGGKESTILLWLLGLGVMLFVFGFQLTVFAYPIAFLKLGNAKVSWRAAVITGVLTWVSVYVFFSMLLKLDFFPGLLFGGEL